MVGYLIGLCWWYYDCRFDVKCQFQFCQINYGILLQRESVMHRTGLYPACPGLWSALSWSLLFHGLWSVLS